jgi:hypothetical protein
MQRDVMVVELLVLGGYAQLKRVRVSVPLIPCLVDNSRYWLPEDLPPPASKADAQPLGRQRLYHANHFYQRRRIGEPVA